MTTTPTIAVIGDRFVRTGQFQAAVRAAIADRAGTAVAEQLVFVTDEHEWPDLPTASDAEIQEFTGTNDRVAALLAAADIAAVHMAALNRAVLAAAPRLRLIACARSGATNVNLSAAAERGITVTNAPGRNARAVAEFTVALIIDLTRGISRGHSALTAAGRWRADLYRHETLGRNLEELTVGLVGMGTVGQLLAPLLGAFGARVLATDPFSDPQVFDRCGAQRVELEQLLARCDVVSLHARVAARQPPLLGPSELAQMRSGAYLIQTARAAVLDYQALYDLLRSGHLAGAALDVYPEEPLPAEHPLLGLDNVVVTPHIAGAARSSAAEGIRVAAAAIAAFLSGESPQHQMRPPPVSAGL